jgi:hypothetical protein
MKTIVITGAGSDVNEAQVRQELETLGPLVDVQIVRDGDPEKPLVLAVMDISDGAAAFIVSRIQKRWHNGRLITAHLMLDHAK